MISSGVVCRELIGRSAELAHLVTCVRPGAARPSATVVVRGEAGVGKTRLIREFADATSSEGTRVVTCAVREYANATYAPLIEALEALGEAPPVSAADDGPADVPDDKGRRFSAFARRFSEAARAAPHGVAIIIEDAHWADAGTMELLRFLTKRLQPEPILFVVTFRSDDIEDDSARARLMLLLEREAEATIALQPLRSDEIERLLRSVLRDNETDVPRPLLNEVRDLSDGRPLFAEELLRGALERIARDGNARAVVPSSIRATVRERFRALDSEDRDVLLHAAVVGRRFSAAFLIRLCEIQPTVVFRTLRRARDQQLVVEEGDEDGDCFAFRHALTREAIYGELLRAEARLLHAKVASALARELALDLGAVAEHAYRARDAEHALAWNTRAGDAAVAAFAHADAARFYERAHEFADDPLQRAELAEKIADALYATGAVEQAATWLANAMYALHQSTDPRGVPRLAIRRSRILWEAGSINEGIATLREIADELADAPAAIQVEARTMLGGLLHGVGRPEEALEQLRAAEGLIEHAEPHIVTRFYGAQGLTFARLGRLTQAREPFAKALARARELGDSDVLLRTLNNQGISELCLGTVAAAQALYDEALAVAESMKNLRIVAWVSQNASIAALVAGDLDRAERHLARAASITHGVTSVHVRRVATSLRLRTIRGDLRESERAEALTAFDDAIRTGSDRSAIAIVGAALACDAIADGRHAEAQAIIARALAGTQWAEAPYWLFSAASRIGAAEDRACARELLATVATTDEPRGVHGLIAIADAREALRRRRRDEGERLAAAAALDFRIAGWALEEGDALEIAGRTSEALALYRRIGAAAEVRRLTETGVAAPRRRGESTLTSREREIVTLVLAGQTTRAIADTLVISERTVETHIASVYRKLGVSSRQDLANLVGEAGTGTNPT